MGIKLPLIGTSSVYQYLQNLGDIEDVIIFSNADNNEITSVMNYYGVVTPLEPVVSESVSIGVKNEGTLITSNVNEFNFIGDGVLVDSNVNISDPFGTISTTGNVIDFTSKKIYNTNIVTTSGTMSANLVGARKGIIQKIYHHSVPAGTLTFDVGATWVLTGDGVYFDGEYNVIFAEWIGGTKIEYWIYQQQ